MAIRNLFILFSVLTTSLSQQDCVMENFEVQSDFDLTQFLGKWYEIKWIPETYIDPEDNYKDYVWRQSLANDSYVSIISHGRVNAEDDYCIDDTAGLQLTEESAKFMYYRRYNSSTRYLTSYWVMLADYQYYYFSFGCRELSSDGVCLEPDAWVWSRTPILSDEHMALIDAKIAEICLTQDQFVITEQNEECPFEGEEKNGQNGSVLRATVNNVLLLFQTSFTYILLRKLKG